MFFFFHTIHVCIITQDPKLLMLVEVDAREGCAQPGGAVGAYGLGGSAGRGNLYTF